MRKHRITGVAVATALVAGVTGGVLTATSATAEPPHHSILASRAEAAAPQRTEALVAQAHALRGVGHVAAPVAKFVEDSLGTAARGTLDKDAADARAAIAATRRAAPARVATRATRDAVSDTLAQLQSEVDQLVSSLTGTVGNLLNAATGVVDGLVGTIGTILGGVLGSAPSLPATSVTTDTPATPSTPASPATPSTPAAPSTPAVPSTPSTPAAPQSPAVPASPASPAVPAS